MKAIIFTGYGSPDNLELREVPTPEPDEHELQIRIYTATVTAGDTEIRRLAMPLWLKLPLRLYAGVARPKRLPILGMEIAGTVTKIGPAVTRFSVGDRVFGATGFGFGGYAEYLCLPETAALSHIPANLGFDEVAPLAIGAAEAYSFVKRAAISAGERVLVYGGSGSIGTYAVQLARSDGAEITAVCGPTTLDLVKSLAPPARSIILQG